MYFPPQLFPLFWFSTAFWLKNNHFVILILFSHLYTPFQFFNCFFCWIINSSIRYFRCLLLLIRPWLVIVCRWECLFFHFKLFPVVRSTPIFERICHHSLLCWFQMPLNLDPSFQPPSPLCASMSRVVLRRAFADLPVLVTLLRRVHCIVYLWHINQWHIRFLHISFTHWLRVLFGFTIETPWRMILVRSFGDLSGPRFRSSFQRPNLQGKRYLVVSNFWATYYLSIRPSRRVPTTSPFQEVTIVTTTTKTLTCHVLPMYQFLSMTMIWQFTGRAWLARQALWDLVLHWLNEDVESSDHLMTTLAD